MLKPIKTEEQYENYLERIYILLQTDLKEDSKESDEMEILSILVKNYEEVHYAIEKPNPIEAIKFRLDQMGKSDSFLSKILGASRKSEILSGKRKLNLPQIRKLSNELHISADVLVQEY
ncbi:HTH-type transcriptional regulator / antitoxin HigA [Chryseobacterium piscicola]|uniref:Transcriptional regulator n=1 Tax=Chryseobacterium piscicola TaxID=551459 RepID=A0A1N7NP13_9FLAO|nr:transcriptional regulator [Chryseobacterium piscicola]PQA90389.1 transcriptional regulator [Chryseobacterium piscicola]SIS99959.1 HTH-type transcriptional regulator / antitoxin HigA [Chryseobacterium piscicola]